MYRKYPSDQIGIGFIVGLIAGAGVGFVMFLLGGHTMKPYPTPVPIMAFWAIVGSLAGLLGGAIWKSARRK